MSMDSFKLSIELPEFRIHGDPVGYNVVFFLNLELISDLFVQ